MSRLPVIHRVTEHDAGPYRMERLDLEFSNGERRRYERLHGRGHGAVAVVPMLMPTPCSWCANTRPACTATNWAGEGPHRRRRNPGAGRQP